MASMPVSVPHTEPSAGIGRTVPDRFPLSQDRPDSYLSCVTPAVH
jgi:hypothetical protein